MLFRSLFDDLLLSDDDAGHFGANIIAGSDQLLCALLIISRQCIGGVGHRSVFVLEGAGRSVWGMGLARGTVPGEAGFVLRQ